MAWIPNSVKSVLVFLLIISPLVGAAQVTSSFSIEKNTCLEEDLVFQNNSSAAVAFQWDFCLGGLDSIPTGENVISVSGASVPTALTLQYDSGSWYGFLSSRSNNKLISLDFGISLDSVPTVVDLGTYGSGPRNLRFVQESNRRTHGLAALALALNSAESSSVSTPAAARNRDQYP